MTLQFTLWRHIKPLCTLHSQDKAYSYQASELERPGNCPMPSGVLTPPLSSEKTEEVLRVNAAAVAAVCSMGQRLSASSAPEPRPLQ